MECHRKRITQQEEASVDELVAYTTSPVLHAPSYSIRGHRAESIITNSVEGEMAADKDY